MTPDVAFACRDVPKRLHISRQSNEYKEPMMMRMYAPRWRHSTEFGRNQDHPPGAGGGGGPRAPQDPFKSETLVPYSSAHPSPPPSYPSQYTVPLDALSPRPRIRVLPLGLAHTLPPTPPSLSLLSLSPLSLPHAPPRPRRRPRPSHPAAAFHPDLTPIPTTNPSSIPYNDLPSHHYHRCRR